MLGSRRVRAGARGACDGASAARKFRVLFTLHFAVQPIPLSGRLGCRCQHADQAADDANAHDREPRGLLKGALRRRRTRRARRIGRVAASPSRWWRGRGASSSGCSCHHERLAKGADLLGRHSAAPANTVGAWLGLGLGVGVGVGEGAGEGVGVGAGAALG